MTDPSDPWARPANQTPPNQPPAAGDPSTQQIPKGGQPLDPPTTRFPPRAEPPQAPPPQHDAGPAWASPPQQAPWSDAPPSEPGEPDEPTSGRLRRFLRDPLSIVLVVVIVLALSAAGLIGGELYARHRGNEIVTEATKCIIKDDATASFGGATPFLWQVVTKNFGNLTIDTAGNQILDVKGMKAQVVINDIRLQDSGDSKGTIGALDATITWSSDGIKQTVQSRIGDLGATLDGVIQQYLGQIPFLSNILGGTLAGGFLAKSITIKDVKTDPAAGRVLVSYGAGGSLVSGSLSVTPVVDNQELSLQVNDVMLGGQPVPHELLEDPLKVFTQSLTDNLPLGIKAKSVQVTDTGVIAAYGTQNATIPTGPENPCFANV